MLFTAPVIEVAAATYFASIASKILPPFFKVTFVAHSAREGSSFCLSAFANLQGTGAQSRVAFG